jgi:hypothetical protein
MRRSQLRLLLSCLLILAVAHSITDMPPAAAQEAADDGPVTAPEPGVKPAPLWDRLIYLPYKNLKTVFEKGDATVLIPYLEYLRLKKGASAMKTDGPPVSAVITESRYVARVEKDLARIQATLTVQVLDKPWAEVPVSFGDAAVGKIKTIGKADGETEQVLLRGRGKGTYSLLLPTKGTHTVELELVAQVHASPDGRSFRFNCPPVGITTFEMVVPDADQTIEISPKRVTLPVNVEVADIDGDVEPGEEEEVNETRIKSSLGSTATISARWFPRTGLKPDMALLASVTNSLDVSIADGLVHTSAALHYHVLRGEMQQLRISAPLGHRILDVSAPGSKLKSWKAVDEEQRQLITIELLTAVRDAIAIEIHTEYDVPDAAFDVAGVLEDGTVNGIHAVDAVRENGLLAVAHGNQVTLSVEDQQGLIRVDATEVAKTRRRAGSLYYKFYSPRFRLNVAANAVEPRITAQQVIRVIFGDDELKLHSVLAINVERAGIFELKVQLPAGLTVDTVNVAGKKEHAVDTETQILTVSLTEKRQGAIQLVVTGHREFDPETDEGNQQLPLLEPLNVARETGLVYVYAPRSIEVITEEQNVSGAYPEPTSGGGSRGAAVVVSAWSYSRRPVAIPFHTRRKPTHLTADVGTTIDVGQQVVKVLTRLDYHVEFAGIDTFRFQVPEAVSAGILIEATGGGAGAAGIKQRSPAAEAVDGWVTWTVVMQQEVTGLQSFLVTFDLKREAEPDAEGAEGEPPAEDTAKPASGEMSVELVRVIGLDELAGRPAVVMSAIQGEVVVLKDRALAVATMATGGDVEPIDVRELQLNHLSRDAFLAYRYHKQPVSLAVTAEKHDIQEVVATVIPRALIEIVIGREEMATYRCRYKIISSERQRLAIDLPKGFEPLAVLIDGNPVTLEKNGGGDDSGRAGGVNPLMERRFVNVARRKASDEPFYLTIQFRAPAGGGRLGSSFGGKEALPLPRIGGESSSAVAVQQLQTVVWIPEEYSLVGSPLNFVAQTHARLTGSLWGPLVGQKQTDKLEEWIGGGQGGSADFPTEGHAFTYSSLSAADEIVVTFYPMSSLASLLSVTLVVVAWLLLRTSWENKLGFLLLAGFVATLIALANADWVFHGLVAARFGIVAMLAWWSIHALAAMKRSQPPTSTTPQAPTGPVIPPAGAFQRYASNPGGSGKW